MADVRPCGSDDDRDREIPSPAPRPANVHSARGVAEGAPNPAGSTAPTSAADEIPPPPRPLPDAVATTAYYVVSEAITNAVKHAEATRIGLLVARRDGQLLVRVTDDGCGGARLGLRSGLVDRVAALGGSVRVESDHGRGSQVEATLPCAS